MTNVFDVRQFKELPKTSGNNEIIAPELIRHIIEAAIWAPSGDNSQPWKFHIEDQELKILEDRERSKFFLSVDNEPLYLSYGALIANIEIAASHYGLLIKWSFESNSSAGLNYVKVSFSRGTVTPDSLYSVILKRCVNRTVYSGQRLERDVLEQLQEEFSDRENSFAWIEDGNSRTVITKMVRISDAIVFEDSRLHGDLFRWIRFKETSTDGMPLKTLGVNSFEAQAFKFFKNWKVVSFLNNLGLSKCIALHSRKLMNSSSGFALFLVPTYTPNAYIESGIQMQRFWLKATQLGLSVQPMSAWVFLITRLLKKSGAGLHQRHIEKLKNMTKEVFEKVSIPQNYIPAMFLRVGYSKPPKAVTLRRSLEDFIQA